MGRKDDDYLHDDGISSARRQSGASRSHYRDPRQSRSWWPRNRHKVITLFLVSPLVIFIVVQIAALN